MTLGEAIASYREEHDISKRGFAKLAELSVTYITALERNETYRGDIPSPSYEVYKKIAKAMNIAVDELLRMVDDDIVVRADEPINLTELAKMNIIKLSDLEMEFVRLLRSMSEENRQALLSLLRRQ